MRNLTIFVNAREIQMDGINWVVISAISKIIFHEGRFNSIRWAVLISHC